MGFLDKYAKKEKPESESEGDEPEEKESDDPKDMMVERLAEKTGVSDPKALIKLIKACMS